MRKLLEDYYIYLWEKATRQVSLQIYGTGRLRCKSKVALSIYNINMNRGLSVGVDVGGSHITSAVIDLDKNIVLTDTVSEKDVDTGAEAGVIIRAWAEAIAGSIKKSPARVAGIGLAMPGPFDYLKGIALIKDQPKLRSLYGMNVSEALQAELDTDIPVRFMNDASAFAVGEAFAGSGKESDRLVAITLGAGFGSAFLDHGIPVIGRDDVPEGGCVWHLPYKEGMADDYFSTRWFVGRYNELTGKNVKGVKEIADLAGSDATAKKIFDEFGAGLGAFMAPLFKAFEAGLLVAGGNISRAWPLFGEAFDSALKQENVNLTVTISELKEHAALLGSAQLLDEPYWEEIKPIVALM